MNRLIESSLAAITAILAFIVFIWYGASVYLNSDVLIDKYERQKTEWNFQLLVKDSWSMGRPILPAPHQILEDLKSHCSTTRLRQSEAWFTMEGLQFLLHWLGL